jgi:hypothetical protein
MGMKATITFVSAFFRLNETPYFTKENNPEWWTPELLLDIVSLGVPFCLYIDNDSTYEDLFREWEKTYPNFRIMPYRVDYKKTWVHLQCKELQDMGYSVSLPKTRNLEKDTYEYLVYSNSNVELMEDAISENIWDTTHFAWIDFNTTKLFQHKQDTLEYIRNLSVKTLSPRFLALPGCWEKTANLDTIATHISWRFCGCFWLGDAETICEFAKLYRAHFNTFLLTYYVLPWEVNYWAYLEYTHGWKPMWYKGNHNDSIVQVSAETYTTKLIIDTRTEYTYPNIPGFYPSSASYLFHQGKHWLNTRYVSYWMYSNGYYRFHNGEHVIENKNVLSELHPDTMIPETYNEMQTIYETDGGIMSPCLHPENKRHFTEGLEDIRLYSVGDDIRFIATTVNYSPNGRPRMIVGNYLTETLEFRECRIIQPPTDTWCEKNWIPLPKQNIETDRWEEWFVYKWCPFELGRINAETGVLQIEKTFKTPHSIFGNIRGSTPFVDYGDGIHLVGLVHFSEEHTPRHYYHMLVLLDKHTFEPVNWTNTFYFEKLSIEFCIGMGFDIYEKKYHFWISRFDRDPVYLIVNKTEIPFCK